MAALLRSSLRTMPGLSLARLLAHLRDPLYRNGYALVFSSTGASVLGLLYWFVAARLYPAETIGVNAALLSTINFLANLAQLNLLNALNRFLPTAGGASKRLIIGAYLTTMGLGLVGSLIFLGGLSWWAPALGVLRHHWLLGMSFTLGVMVYALFSLQDGVLVGLRQATWVPVENLAFAVAKLLLLALPVALFADYGIYASWLVPMALALLPVNWLIFRWLLPNHLASTQGQTRPLGVTDVARYIAGDYFGSLIWTATICLMPLLVLQRAGATANGYYYMAWTITYALYLISRNMGMSLVTEAALAPSQLLTLSYRTLSQSFRLLTPLTLGLVAGAPWLLHFFGADYATEATTLLRLLVLSALPGVVTTVYVAMVRSQRRLKALIIVNFALCLSVLTISYLFLDRYGTVAVGWAWLVSQSVVALVLLLTEMRPLWLLHINLGPLLHLLAWPRTLVWRWQRRQTLAQVNDTALPLLTTVPHRAGLPAPTTWHVAKILRTVSEMTVAVLATSTKAGVAILKLPQSACAAASLQRQAAVVATLRAHPALQTWIKWLPTPLTTGTVAGRFYLVELLLPGVDGTRLRLDEQGWHTVQTAACRAISHLHQQTATTTMVEAALLHRWVEEPIAALRRLQPALLTQAEYQHRLDRLQAELTAALTGRTVGVSWIHGDFTPGNVLLDPAQLTITGLIDWELAAPNELPQLDLLQFFITTRMIRQQSEYGDVIRTLLTDQGWQEPERLLLATAQNALPGATLADRTLLLLCWLRHIAASVTKAEQYAHHHWWKIRNLEAVLLVLE